MDLDTRDEVMRDTVAHTKRVAHLLADVIHQLAQRAAEHDRSKFSVEEWPHFVAATPRLKEISYGTEEYTRELANLRPAIDHHQKANSHHPEFYSAGVAGMDLIDLVEMVCDWKASGERHADGSIERSIDIGVGRFGIEPQLAAILRNTVERMGWVT